MVALQQDIVIKQGATFELPIACVERDPDTLELVVRDLAGWTGTMQVRPNVDSETIYAEAEVEIDVGTGIVTAVIDDLTTADYTWRSGVYDLMITDGIVTDCLVEGAARLTRQVTR